MLALFTQGLWLSSYLWLLHQLCWLQVHIFADLRHATGWPRNGSMMVDSCVFTNANKSASLYVPAVTTQMHDNPVRLPCAAAAATVSAAERCMSMHVV